MKRFLRMCGICICLVLLLSLSVYAQETDTYIEEQLEQSGANGLWDDMTDETKALYEAIGIDHLTDLGDTVFSPKRLTEMIGALLAQHGKTPFSVLGALLGAIVLCAYLGGLKDTVEGGVHTVYQTVSILAVCTVTMVPFMQCIRAVQDALSGAAVFMGSFSPVYITTLAAGGQLQAAASYQTILLLFSQLLTWLANGVLLPCLLVSFALGTVSATTGTANLMKISDMLLKAVSWTLGIIGAVFTILLTVNNMLGSAGETLGSRIAKLSLSSFVPVVGGALSEAFLTVKGCVGVVRTTVGAFGMVTTALMILPSLLQCVCWQICLFVADTAAETFEQTALSSFLKIVQKVTKTMIALLSICGLFMIIGTAIVSKGGAA